MPLGQPFGSTLAGGRNGDARTGVTVRTLRERAERTPKSVRAGHPFPNRRCRRSAVAWLGRLLALVATLASGRVESRESARLAPFLGFSQRQVREQRARNLAIAERFFSSLSRKDRLVVRGALSDIRTAADALVPLMSAEVGPHDHTVPIFLMVQGLDMKDDFVFYEPFHLFWQRHIPLYFHKWSRFAALPSNIARLRQTYEALLQQVPPRQVIVLAYSAGGVLALRALDDLLTRRPIGLERLTVYTAAAPIFGFGAPKFFPYFGAPFVGASAVAIGIGNYHHLKNKPLRQCETWISTSCKLDVIACESRRGHIHPQSGLISPPQSPPCGADRVRSFPEDSHTTILTRLVRAVLSAPHSQLAAPPTEKSPQ